VEEKEEKHEEESKSLDNEPKEDVVEEKPKIIVQEEPKAKDEAKENEVTKEDKHKEQQISLYVVVVYIDNIVMQRA
jgi:hypothetical protein